MFLRIVNGFSWTLVYANEEAMELSLMNALKMLGILRTIFRNNMEELSRRGNLRVLTD